jgi:hypothetical protein
MHEDKQNHYYYIYVHARISTTSNFSCAIIPTALFDTRLVSNILSPSPLHTHSFSLILLDKRRKETPACLIGQLSSNLDHYSSIVLLVFIVTLIRVSIPTV